ncbi:hypothetical protein BDC45DRAFT_567880 [Circinella umbellata]|nr:hypothetical protein BDC45DRAFT_567880 [Circinella umbellata]
MYAGGRAEPKFLRNPTSLEYLSSGLNWVSDQLTSNLQKRQSNTSLFTQQEQHGPHLQNLTHCHDHYDHPQQQPLRGVTTSSDNEIVTFAAFQNVHRSLLSSPSLLLLLGYRNGFQVWDVTSPENVHETCSLRDQTIGDVHGMHILEDPNIDDNNCNLVDLYAEVRPLLAIISSFCSTEEVTSSKKDQSDTNNDHNASVPSQCNSSSMTRKKLYIFSLSTHQMIKDFTELSEQGINVTSIQSNGHAIILGCLDDQLEASLHILSASDFSKQEILTDVYSHSVIKPVFTLGTRYIAYASAATNSDYESNEFLTHIVNDKDVTGAAKDIAKEVVHGVKSLSEYSYHSISNYFAQQHTNGSSSPLSPTPTTTIKKELTENNSSSSITNNNTYNNRRSYSDNSKGVFPYLNYSIGHGVQKKISGSIMIRDLQKLQSVFVHFQAHIHSHPITQLAFNPSGTLLLSVTNQGHTFHVFSLVSNLSGALLGGGGVAEPPVTHIYSLSRGITDAHVDDVHFSTDSLWCTVSTARGTTHVYPINPYGGATEIISHVQGKVLNPKRYPHSSYFNGAGGNHSFYRRRMTSNNLRATSLNPIVRIKQRRPMRHHDQNSHCNYQQNNFDYNNNWTTSSNNHSISTLEHSLNDRQQYRTKLATHLLPMSKTPHLLNNSAKRAPLSFWKSHVSNLLTNKTSSLSASIGNSTTDVTSDSYLSYDNAWSTTSVDQNDNNRMFGFDEEERQEKGHYYDNTRSSVTTNTTTTTVGDGFQDIYSIHPEGILTLHRYWLKQTMVKRRENGRAVEKLELNVKEGDIAEWNVAQKPDWNQVRMMKKKKHNRQQQQQHQQTGWLSYAEITTYDSDFEKPLWDRRYYPHISFHTFIEQENGMLSGNNTTDSENDNNKHNGAYNDYAKMYFNSPFVLPTVQLYFTQDVPEPYASRIDRVGRTSAASRDGTLLLDDALAELEENISNAMTSSFSPSSSAGFLNTPRPNSSSSTSIFSFTTTSSNPSVIAADQVSFEDACLVTVGNEDQEKVNDHDNDTYNNDNNSTTNDNELKVGEQEVCFPDGDNELASPHDEDNLVMLNNDR